MVTIFATIGFLAALWWVTGVIAFTYSKVYVSPGAPLRVKLVVPFHAGFTFPWIMLRTGAWPSEILAFICPSDPDDEEKARQQAFVDANCPCDKCKARRGE